MFQIESHTQALFQPSTIIQIIQIATLLFDLLHLKMTEGKKGGFFFLTLCIKVLVKSHLE